MDSLIDGLASNCTHQGVADVLFDANRGRLVHVEKDKWFQWTGRTWKLIVDVNVHSLFKGLMADVVRRMAWWTSPAGRDTLWSQACG